MKILFLSRAFPPVIGGIENQNSALSRWLPKFAEVTTIANTRGKTFLPLFLPYVTIRALFALHRYDVLLLGDGVLAPVGFLLSLFYPTKIFVAVVHGLDITFGTKKGFLSRLYHTINIPALKNLDQIFTVSEQTKMIAIAAGIDTRNITVIPNGIDPDTVCANYSRTDLDHLLGKDTEKKFVITRVGRYVKHKGVEWFIRNVVPLLPDHTLFVAAGAVVNQNTAGDKDYFPLCKKAVQELHLEHKVCLLTNISQEQLKILLNTSDLFVSPNIPVLGSMEGFGINVLEASVCRLPVIASRLEGLQEAITDGKNGILVEPENATAFRDAIVSFVEDKTKRTTLGSSAKQFTETHYHWNIIARLYKERLEKIAEMRHT